MSNNYFTCECIKYYKQSRDGLKYVRGAVDRAQFVEHLSSIHKALGSNPGTSYSEVW